MNKCVFAGCFDPFTTGHLDVVERLAAMFDEVFVVVSKNAEKKLVLSGEERFALVKKAVCIPNVKVVLHEGLLVDFCKKSGANCIIKGVRNATDFDYERLQWAVNKELGGIETLFLPCSADKSFVSSSFVREMLALDMDVSKYVPEQIVSDVVKAYSRKR